MTKKHSARRAARRRKAEHYQKFPTPADMAMELQGQAENLRVGEPATETDRIVQEVLGESNIDPAMRIDGMPANMGKPLLPHVITFTGIISTISKVYRPSDEALRHSWENARYMLMDCSIQECLEQRMRSTALLNWHLECDDETDPAQMELVDAMTDIIKQTPRFMQYRESLLRALWFGKYANKHQFGRKKIKGVWRHVVQKWEPTHGDKLVFRYDTGTGDYDPDQIGIRVGAGFQSLMARSWQQARMDQIQICDIGLAYFMKPEERNLLCVHKHMVEDGEWEDVESAGRIHGVGIRHRIYWTWVQMQEALAWLMEFLERSAFGMEIWYYPWGNAEARNRMYKAAKDRIGQGRNIVLVPRPEGETAQAFGVERIEPAMAGADVLKDIITNLFGHRIKRYILGQTLTSEAGSTGLGSNLASVHLDTYLQIVRYDAQNLEETITKEFVDVLKFFNFPAARDVPIHFRIDTEAQDVEAKLAGWRQAFEMGCRLSEAEVMDMIGATAPGKDDVPLISPQILQAQMQMEQMQQQAAMQQQQAQAQQQMAQQQQAALPQPPPADQVAAQEQYSLVGLRDRIEAAARRTDRNPSEAAKKAGNYEKGRVWIQGMEVAIENPRGSTRYGRDEDGQSWSCVMPHHYGYIKQTESEADGDHVDCFVGPHPESQIVFVIDQLTRGGVFDEHKCMIGFTNEQEALKAYRAAYNMEPNVGGVRAMTMSEFRAWLAKGDTGHRITQQIKYAKYTDTPEFQKWFRNSKVVDESGQPLRVFHSTAAKPFTVFKRKRNDVGMHFGTAGQAADRWEYKNRGAFDPPAGSRTYAVHLNIQNPLRIHDIGNFDAENLHWALGNHPSGKFTSAELHAAKHRNPITWLTNLRNLIAKKGFDGLVYANTGETPGSEPFRNQLEVARGDLNARFGSKKSGFDVEEQKTPEYQAFTKATDAYQQHRNDNAEDSWVALHPNQIKSATGNTGDFSDKSNDIRYAAGDQPEQPDNVNWENLQSLGYTDDLREAGYVDPKGQMIDLSGKNNGGQPGMRALDHREAGGTNGMLELGFRHGYIRHMPEAHAVDVSKEPTDQQYQWIHNLARHHGGDIVLEARAGDWKYKPEDDQYDYPQFHFYQEYAKGTKPEKIVNDLQMFYANPQKEYRGPSWIGRYAAGEETEAPPETSALTQHIASGADQDVWGKLSPQGSAKVRFHVGQGDDLVPMSSLWHKYPAHHADSSLNNAIRSLNNDRGTDIKEVHEFDFRDDEGGGDMYGVTGKGHAKEALTKVARHVLSGLRQFQPPLLTFTAYPMSRVKAYRFLASRVGRLAPYRAFEIPYGDNDATFVLAHNDIAEHFGDRLEDATRSAGMSALRRYAAGENALAEPDVPATEDDVPHEGVFPTQAEKATPTTDIEAMQPRAGDPRVNLAGIRARRSQQRPSALHEVQAGTAPQFPPGGEMTPEERMRTMQPGVTYFRPGETAEDAWSRVPEDLRPLNWRRRTPPSRTRQEEGPPTPRPASPNPHTRWNSETHTWELTPEGQAEYERVTAAERARVAAQQDAPQQPAEAPAEMQGPFPGAVPQGSGTPRPAGASDRGSTDSALTGQIASAARHVQWPSNPATFGRSQLDWKVGEGVDEVRMYSSLRSLGDYAPIPGAQRVGDEYARETGQPRPANLEFVFRNTTVPAGSGFDVTGTGHAKEAMLGASSHILAALRQFQPGTLYFSAQKASRVRAYEFMAKRLKRLMDYKVFQYNDSFDDNGTPTHAHFFLVRPDVAPYVARYAHQLEGIKQYAAADPDEGNEDEVSADGVFDFLPGGPADGMPDSKFPAKELQRGREEESEHTDNPEIAGEIAKDHLVEGKHYAAEVKQYDGEGGIQPGAIANADVVSPLAALGGKALGTGLKGLKAGGLMAGGMAAHQWVTKALRGNPPAAGQQPPPPGGPSGPPPAPGQASPRPAQPVPLQGTTNAYKGPQVPPPVPGVTPNQGLATGMRTSANPNAPKAGTQTVKPARKATPRPQANPPVLAMSAESQLKMAKSQQYDAERPKPGIAGQPLEESPQRVDWPDFSTEDEQAVAEVVAGRKKEHMATDRRTGHRYRYSANGPGISVERTRAGWSTSDMATPEAQQTLRDTLSLAFRERGMAKKS